MKLYRTRTFVIGFTCVRERVVFGPPERMQRGRAVPLSRSGDREIGLLNQVQGGAGGTGKTSGGAMNWRDVPLV